MQKPASTDVPVHELIRHRWSPRAFGEKPVPAGILRALFEAARWAPSSNNEQPWAYLVATKDDGENFANMLGVLVEFNASWAKHAPVLALSVAHLKTQRDGKPNRVALHDVGSATAQQFQAMFDADTAGAKQIDRAAWRRRPLTERLLELFELTSFLWQNWL